MRRLAVGLGLVLVLALASIALAHTLVILNPGNNYTDELEPGVFLSRLSKRVPGVGPLMGTNVLFACGSCEVASFPQQEVTQLGGAGKPCGSAVRPIDIVLGGILLCLKSTASGQLYDFNLLAWTSFSFGGSPTGGPFCVDADGGTTCANTGNNAAYIRTTLEVKATDPLGLLEHLIQDVVVLNLPKGTESELDGKARRRMEEALRLEATKRRRGHQQARSIREQCRSAERQEDRRGRRGRLGRRRASHHRSAPSPLKAQASAHAQFPR